VTPLFRRGMTIIYELWDVRAGQLVESFDSEIEALLAVGNYLAVNAADYATDLGLRFDDGQGHHGLIAEGAELARRARAAIAA
jgi:hypothetical protein